jgi:hypothetical protein
MSRVQVPSPAPTSPRRLEVGAKRGCRRAWRAREIACGVVENAVFRVGSVERESPSRAMRTRRVDIHRGRVVVNDVAFCPSPDCHIDMTLAHAFGAEVFTLALEVSLKWHRTRSRSPSEPVAVKRQFAVPIAPAIRQDRRSRSGVGGQSARKSTLSTRSTSRLMKPQSAVYPPLELHP